MSEVKKESRYFCPLCGEEVLVLGDGMFGSYCKCGFVTLLAKKYGAKVVSTVTTGDEGVN